jgi:hypothetical protein
MSEDRSGFIARAVGWLRQGYPTGVPRQDYVVLLGLLQRTLTEEEIREIANDLQSQSLLDGSEPLTTEDIEKAIQESVLKPPTPEDVVRVSARLAAGGWPLADPPPKQ